MARGWESKSVEAQQEEAREKQSPAKPRLTPAEVSKLKEREGLLLSRQRVLEQLRGAQNAHHKEMLQAALVDLDTKLAAFE
jgi:hypothetical protein